jgi:hypothetical protein
MRTSLATLALVALTLSSCDKLRAARATHPLELGIGESPTSNSEHAPWVEPADRALREEFADAKSAFLAGFPDPIGRRYARCGRSVGWLVTIPGGVVLLDWAGRLVPCEDPHDVNPPFPGERFVHVARANGFSVELARRNALTRALILRCNVGSDALSSGPRLADSSAIEAWAAEAWRAALGQFVGDVEGATRERALFFARVSLAAIGAYERAHGSTRGNPKLWFAPTVAAMARQLAEHGERITVATDSHDELDGGTAADASRADVSTVVMDILLRRRSGDSARLRERLSSPPDSPLRWLTPAMIERTSDPASIEPLLHAVEHDERLAAVRVIPVEQPERERPARVFELAYAALAVTLAFDPIFEELGADGVVRPRADAARAHREFTGGSQSARAQIAARFRARMGAEPVTRAELARWQLAAPALGPIAPSAARRLPRAPVRPPSDPVRRAQLEGRTRADAELIVRRSDELFAEDPARSCGVLVELERVAPGYSSAARAAMVDRFAVHTALSGDALGCVGRVLRPRADESAEAVALRYAQWIERVGAELYSASPCETLGIGAVATASAATVRAHAVGALESLRTERAAGGLLRALVRWVRPESIRCAAANETYREWARAVLARGVPLGFSLTAALRDGEAWGRRRRCAIVHDGYARIENRISLRDLAGVAFAFADTREPCALATRAPALDGMRFALEAAIRERAEQAQQRPSGAE